MKIPSLHFYLHPSGEMSVQLHCVLSPGVWLLRNICCHCHTGADFSRASPLNSTTCRVCECHLWFIEVVGEMRVHQSLY